MKMIAGWFVYAVAVATVNAVEIQTTALPSGDAGLPYNAVLSAANGAPPYSWSWSDAGIAGYAESTQPNSFSAVDSPQGWQADYAEWILPLPFDFPFSDKSFSSVRVTPDGQLILGNFEAEIEVLTSNLDTTGGDIYVASTPSAVTVRWAGFYRGTSQPIACSVTLSKGGTVTMKYGSGNASGGGIGLFSNNLYSPSIFSSSGSMNGAADIVFKPMLIPSFGIDGLSMSPGGEISGTPVGFFSNLVTVGVVDAGGDVAVSVFELAILDDRDRDGMPDAWERVIVDDNPSDAIATIQDVLRDGNYDADGFSNIEEYLLGLDPLVPDGDALDTVEEGLELMAHAFTNEADSAYLWMIDNCFATVIAANPTNYAARIYRAASRLISLINNEDLRLFLEESGGSLGYGFELSGMFELTNAPLPDAALDRIFSNVLPALEASFDDLEFIPTDWAGTVEISTNYFQMDESVYADIGDVTAAMAAIKLFCSSLLTLKSQSLNVDYEKMLLPVDGPIASIVIDGETNDWASVPLQLIGGHDSGIGFAKAARSASSVYLLFVLNGTGDDVSGMSASVSLGLESGMEINLQPYWGQTSVWFEATGDSSAGINWFVTNGMAEIEILVPPGNVFSNACIQDFTVDYGGYDPYYGYLWYGEDYVSTPMSTPADTFFQNHPDFLQSVRSEGELSAARTCIQQAVDLSQLADTMIASRTDTLMHFIEYDPTNELERAEFFGQVQQVEDSLTAPLLVVATNSMGEVLMEETVHLGAFYQPDYITRAMLPEFWQIVGQPLADTFPDPTFGGILPNMSPEKMMTYFRQGGEEGIDWDGDGLPNGWEYLYGGHPTGLSALGDNDDDGQNNLREYIAGSNPADKTSFFKVSDAQSVNSGFKVEWVSVPERSYSVKRAPDPGAPFRLLEQGILYPANSYTDSVHSAESSGFYKVDVELK